MEYPDKDTCAEIFKWVKWWFILNTLNNI
jgi:hypothetical protein